MLRRLCSQAGPVPSSFSDRNPFTFSGLVIIDAARAGGEEA